MVSDPAPGSLVREEVQEGLRLRLDRSSQSLRLELPSQIGWHTQDEEAALYATLSEWWEHLQRLRGSPGAFVSASVLMHKARRFDEGLREALQPLGWPGAELHDHLARALEPLVAPVRRDPRGPRRVREGGGRSRRGRRSPHGRSDPPACAVGSAGRLLRDGRGSTHRPALRPARDAMIEVRYAHDAEQIEQVRALFVEYQASLDVDLGFQGFAEELAGLPGSYAPPSGRLLLATVDAIPRGCAALQAMTSESCEMKRLYVQPGQRGAGLGRMLARRVLDEARAIGYRRIFLDTLPSMTRAAAMYVALGFEEVPPYRHNPVPGTRYMALSL